MSSSIHKNSIDNSKALQCRTLRVKKMIKSQYKGLYNTLLIVSKQDII